MSGEEPREEPREGFAGEVVSGEYLAERSLVHWPDDAHPSESRIYGYNEIRCALAPADIWPVLIRAAEWPEWYGNCKRMDIDGGGVDLADGTRFHWTTFGVRVHTVVTEFEPPTRLTWSGRAPGSTGAHGWVIEATDDGCRIVTEEVQRGLIPFIGAWYLRPGLLKQHKLWLRGLVTRAG